MMAYRLYVLGTPRRLLSRVLINAFAGKVGPGTWMYSYANGLISMTQGRGSYSMEFSHRDFVPQKIAERVIAAHKLHHEGDGEGELASA